MIDKTAPIAIAGAGSIGCYVGGCLALAGRQVAFLARPRVAAPLREAGLRVSDLDRSEAFYSAALGLKRTQRFGNQARFLAADDYHHHIGLNTWGGIRRPQPPGALGFSEATFARVGSAESRTVRDPDGLTLQIHDAR